LIAPCPRLFCAPLINRRILLEDTMADMKSRAVRALAVLLVAFGAGHLVQNMSKPDTPQRQARTEVGAEPQAIQPLAAEAAAAEPIAPKVRIAATAPAAPVVLAAAEATVAAPPAAAEAVPSLTPEASPLPEPVVADACAVTLDLMAEPNAMIGLTLLAPCRGNQRVVIKHGGLAVSGQTTANGALFTGIPALETAGLISVMFADGQTSTASIEMPEVADLRRFGVQWQADDAFQLHAFEASASYGDAGHISGADPHRPAPGAPAKGGFLTLLGDSTTDNPMLAEVYTYPSDTRIDAEIVIEAAVTATTCGRELLGETLTSNGGEVFVTDLTLAMPECDGVGDYLVLKNLVPDLNIALAN
jgi:hypothetical protein